ncbi:MAG: hypothetical protein EBZ81_02465 [Betaproteobacteria bacterium]|nr:hypothetical protein [Betaproteobacteria bacterium]
MLAPAAGAWANSLASPMRFSRLRSVQHAVDGQRRLSEVRSADYIERHPLLAPCPSFNETKP